MNGLISMFCLCLFPCIRRSSRRRRPSSRPRVTPRRPSCWPQPLARRVRVWWSCGSWRQPRTSPTSCRGPGTSSTSHTASRRCSHSHSELLHVALLNNRRTFLCLHHCEQDRLWHWLFGNSTNLSFKIHERFRSIQKVCYWLFKLLLISIGKWASCNIMGIVGYLSSQDMFFHRDVFFFFRISCYQ